MKKGIKIAGIALIALLAARVGFAQRNFDASKMAERNTKMITQKITGLTDAQKAKIKVVEDQYAKSMGDLFSKNSDDRQGMRTKMKSLRDENDKKLKEIFNDDQDKQYVKMQEDRRKRMGNNRRGRPGQRNGGNGGNGGNSGDSGGDQ